MAQLNDLIVTGDSRFINDIKGYIGAGRKAGSTRGQYSTAEGYNNVADGNYSHAEGESTSAIGQDSHAEGSISSAVNGGHAEGRGSSARGSGSHAEGYHTYSYGNMGSHSEGITSKAGGQGSHAEGSQTCAYGDASHTEGSLTTAYGNYSHAEGYKASAYAEAHAEGYQTTCQGNRGAHAEGCNTKVMGTSMYSGHAEGYYTTVTGDYGAHAEGEYTCAAGNSQHVCGLYNQASTSRIFIIGGGSSSQRKNAMSVTSAGAAYAASWNTGGADYAEYFEWADSNINKEDRVGYFVTLDENDNTKIRIANNNDEYILGVISSTPGVLGNNDYTDIWKKAFIKDNFGRIQYKEIPDFKENLDTGEMCPVLDKNGKQVYHKEPILNPEFDQTLEYTHREDRPEWDAVGMLGVIIVYDDNTCVPGKYCTVNKDGIATLVEKYNKNENCYRVMERITDNIIKIIFK